MCVLLSMCVTARRNMKIWIFSGTSDRWRVELNVGDLGGHLDTTLRVRAGTLAGRVQEELSKWLLFMDHSYGLRRSFKSSGPSLGLRLCIKLKLRLFSISGMTTF